MKKTMTVLGALLTAGSVLAQSSSVTDTDGDGNIYGNVSGVVIDFDSTAASAAVWSPPLSDGTTYNLNSLSFRQGATTDAASLYLGVYTGLASGVLSGFLGASANAINWSTVADGTWAQYTFSGINVTADSTVGSGSGLLYFVFQAETTAIGGTEVGDISLQRINGFGSTDTMLTDLNHVIAYGAPVTTRALEYQATVTPVPEPASLAMIGLSGAGLLLAIRRQKK
jgi:hypothetical protein